MKKTLIKSLDDYRAHIFRNLAASRGEIDPWEGFDAERIKRVTDFHELIQGKRGKAAIFPHPDDSQYYWACKDSAQYREACDMNDRWSGADRYMNTIEEAYGLIMTHDCYDYDEDGNEIDEEGNIIEDDRSCPEALKFEDWVYELTYPFILIEWVDSTSDRTGDGFICGVETVELTEFCG